MREPQFQTEHPRGTGGFLSDQDLWKQNKRNKQTKNNSVSSQEQKPTGSKSRFTVKQLSQVKF